MRPDRPGEPVAAQVADQRLRNHSQLIRYEIDWAGPVDLPLIDEVTVQAACGIMHVHGRAVGRPTPVAVDYAATVAGMLAAQGVLAALIGRARGMRVDAVRTSVSQAALLSLSQYLAAATADDDEEPYDTGSATFASADGVSFEIETLDAEGWRRFWDDLGADPVWIRRGWRPFLHRFATATCPIPAALHAVMAQWRYAAVTEVASRAKVSVLRVRRATWPPAGPVSRRTPWQRTPMTGTKAGVPGNPVTSPLEGVVVVESTRRVQGPLAGHLLRMLGAELVRIEPPGGDPMRGMPPMAGDCSARFLALNKGKRVVEIDLTSTAGRVQARELVAGADVFLHNWAPGKATQWGLDADDLVRTRPGLVYAWASGWGDAFGVHPPLGTDFLVQSHSGLAAALRPEGEPPAPSLMTLTDVLGGLVCAEGVLAALLERVHTGHGQRVDSSLFSATHVVPRPCSRPVWTMLDRPLRSLDGYLMLARDSREPRQVAGALGLSGASCDGIALRCADEKADTVVRCLAEAGLSAAVVRMDLRELAADPRFSAAINTDGYACPLAPWEFS
jgi:crotonobetainyl-CoA:carnitine CoA-transferase CaiB-like acyl-CoA transferase